MRPVLRIGRRSASSDATADRATVATGVDDLVERRLLTGLALVPAGANVVMQLSLAPVGRAVLESRVESGALTRHPIKRTRTTLSYLVLAMCGTEDERAWLGREVSRQHRGVRSGEASPVAYDAFDPSLQLWVAACLYRGALDVLALYGESPEAATLDALYERSARLATVLQVPPGAWPATRADFDAYWNARLAELTIDEPTRRYLVELVTLGFVWRPLSRLLGPWHARATLALLDPPFRALLGLTLSPAEEARVRRQLAGLARLYRALPPALARAPFTWVLADARARRARGRALT